MATSGRTTSTAFRVPTVSSAYHEKCIAKSVKAIHEASARAQSEKSYPQNAYRDCNVVAQERIWSEYVQKEMKTAKTWEQNWGFLMEYDYKGKPQAKKQLPEREPYYGTLVPPTVAKQIGTQAHTPNSKEMYRLEMTLCRRKRKTDLENYYDS